MSGRSELTAAPGVITKASPRSVDHSLERLQAMLATKDLTLFSVVDHSGEAERAGQHMPNTKLVIFGSPAAGTPLMLASPLSALDLPLKILIWEDPNGATFVSYNAPAYLASRHDLSDELTARITGIDAIAEALVGD
ncbi:MAG TPA: DUF302 domain-containing protein [Acidimicrobiales bacterium]|nr:DUF302 domain-containing protein [Acidimicrobiales bacterium]